MIFLSHGVYCAIKTFFSIFMYSLMFVCNYIYVVYNIINNFICITQCVIFKHLYSFLSMLESAITSIPTPDLYNRSFTVFLSKAHLLHNSFAFSRLRVKISVNNKYKLC